MSSRLRRLRLCCAVLGWVLVGLLFVSLSGVAACCQPGASEVAWNNGECAPGMVQSCARYDDNVPR